MFFYKLTVTRKTGTPADRSVHTDRSYHHCTQATHMGEHVGAQLARRNVTSVRVDRINQAAYRRAMERS
jgi:hypothetical protein